MASAFFKPVLVACLLTMHGVPYSAMGFAVLARTRPGTARLAGRDAPASISAFAGRPDAFLLSRRTPRARASRMPRMAATQRGGDGSASGEKRSPRKFSTFPKRRKAAGGGNGGGRGMLATHCDKRSRARSPSLSELESPPSPPPSPAAPRETSSRPGGRLQNSREAFSQKRRSANPPPSSARIIFTRASKGCAAGVAVDDGAQTRDRARRRAACKAACH